MKHKRVCGSKAWALAALLGLGAASAQAVTVTYVFDTTDVGAFGAGPYGTVDLVENGANVDVKVTLRSDLDFVVTGGPHTIFAFNATGIGVSDITNIVFAGVPGGGGSLTVVQDPNAQATPYGRFLFGIDCVDNSNQDKCAQGGSGPWVDPLTFTVLGATAADFAFRSYTGNAQTWSSSANGYFFGADVICRDTKSVGSCNGATGSIAVNLPGDDNDDDNDVPEPGTLALLGLGLMGLGFGRRRRA